MRLEYRLPAVVTSMPNAVPRQKTAFGADLPMAFPPRWLRSGREEGILAVDRESPRLRPMSRVLGPKMAPTPGSDPKSWRAPESAEWHPGLAQA